MRIYLLVSKVVKVGALLLVFASVSCAEENTVKKKGVKAAQHKVQFEAVADSVWVIPKQGESTQVDIGLRIKNLGLEPLCFYILDTIGILLTDSEGKRLPMDGGRDGTRPGNPFSDPVEPGGELIIDHSAELAWESDTKLRLTGDDGFGGIWYVDGLQQGVYALQIVYENRGVHNAEQPCVWIGKIATQIIEIELEVKDAKKKKK